MSPQHNGRPGNGWNWLDAVLVAMIVISAVATGVFAIPGAEGWGTFALDAQRPYAWLCIWLAVGLLGVILFMRFWLGKARWRWMNWLIGCAVVGLATVLAMPAARWWLDRPRPGVQVVEQYVQSVGRDTTELEMGYLLYLPPGYDRDAKTWPLVVYLHGAGCVGYDLRRLRTEGLPKAAAEGRRFDFILLSPQCGERQGWNPPNVVSLIKHISQTYRVDPERVYLTGYSMGGFGTWETAAFAPGRFAAIVPIAGGGRPEDAGRLVDTPIWAFHGAQDEVVPLMASQETVDAVRAAGGNAKLTIYPGQGHGIANMPYEDPELCKWLLAQRRQVRNGRLGDKSRASADRQGRGESVRSIAGDGSGQ